MKKKIVFFTGADLATESGISAFKDGGLWTTQPIELVATEKGFKRSTKKVLDFYNKLRAELATAEPNEVHRMIASFEDNYDCTVITQNHDDLHERAGSTNIIHLCGELLKATSSKEPGNLDQVITLPADNLVLNKGDLAKDGSQLRPFIVWFGEQVPMLGKAAEAIAQADIIVAVGLSYVLAFTTLLLTKDPWLVKQSDDSTPEKDCQIYFVGPKNVPMKSEENVTHIEEGGVEGMKKLCALLK